MGEGEGAFSNFNWAYRFTATSDDENDDEVEEIEENNEGDDTGGGRNFWSHPEDEVLVRSWLEVSKNKKTNTNQKGAEFWGKIEQIFNNVRLYRERCFEQGTDGITKGDLLRVRGLEQLRCRWRRLNVNCSKFAGAYAHAEEKRGSGQSDDDVIKKTSTQSNVSKRSRINEAGNYSSSTNLETPTSGDMDCSGFPYSADSNKSKGKSKVMNAPSESFQQWLDTLQHMNLARQTENEVEMEKIKYRREKEAGLAQLEKDREARKQRKINLELFKILEEKPYLSEEDQERRNNLVKVLFP
ncbi:glutathione S-transferase T2-like [Chenopodium quinoa]|uniref:glutathione S-transferase T2-like n=1 Tax=Chenopodium quinoa TaxID=63459 RepID=UPI000B77DCEE|nr:glutathione S-transferase T2-like [Chenopodium quinoa]